MSLVSYNFDSRYEWTCIGNLVAVITNGTAVQGLGKLGSEPVLPSVEGTCLLLNLLAHVESIPLCFRDTSSEKMIRHIKNISPGFCAIHLQSIKPP